MIFIGLVYLHFGKLLFWLIKKYTRLCASQSVGAFILILHTHTHTQCTLIWWLNEYFSSFWGYGMSLIFGRRNNDAKEIIRTRYFRSFKKMFEQNICFFIGFLYLHYTFFSKSAMNHPMCTHTHSLTTKQPVTKVCAHVYHGYGGVMSLVIVSIPFMESSSFFFVHTQLTTRKHT